MMMILLRLVIMVNDGEVSDGVGDKDWCKVSDETVSTVALTKTMSPQSYCDYKLL